MPSGPLAATPDSTPRGVSFHLSLEECPSEGGNQSTDWEDGHSQGHLRKHVGSQQAEPENPLKGAVSVDALKNQLPCAWKGSESHTPNPCPQGTKRKVLQCEKIYIMFWEDPAGFGEVRK